MNLPVGFLTDHSEREGAAHVPDEAPAGVILDRSRRGEKSKEPARCRISQR